MDDYQLSKYALIQALITEREAMLAENCQREQLGESMAYSRPAFDYIADQLRAEQIAILNRI